MSEVLANHIINQWGDAAKETSKHVETEFAVKGKDVFHAKPDDYKAQPDEPRREGGLSGYSHISRDRWQEIFGA